MSDIVDRLRASAERKHGDTLGVRRLLLPQAANEIERLRGFIQDEVINDQEGDLDLVRWKATNVLKGETP